MVTPSYQATQLSADEAKGRDAPARNVSHGREGAMENGPGARGAEHGPTVHLRKERRPVLRRGTLPRKPGRVSESRVSRAWYMRARRHLGLRRSILDSRSIIHPNLRSWDREARLFPESQGGDELVGATGKGVTLGGGTSLFVTPSPRVRSNSSGG